MARTKGSTNKHPVSNVRITVRLDVKLLEKLDLVAVAHGQNRSEAVLEALQDYVKKG